MNPLLKTGAFAAALAAVCGTAYGVGTAIGPHGLDPAPVAAGHDDRHNPAGETDTATRGTGDAVPAGLQVAQDGYALDLETGTVPAGPDRTLRFTVRDADGDPVTRFTTAHGKQLHLIVASRELTTYRHLHPVRAADGTWSTPVDLPDAGGYRVFADFVPADREEKDDGKSQAGLTLGSDLTVTGPYRAAQPSAPAATTTVDGYAVSLRGTLRPGTASELTFTVRRDGRPVTGLQPYLGAYGHLVALRAGDLAYLHVHPHEEAHATALSGPDVAFTADAPSAGTYRLFLDFKVDGTVRTAAFTVRVGAQPPASPPPAPTPEHGTGAPHGH
ncbi:hypothetical protein ACIPPJ_17390 [Streptomyces sp. NPDC086091]|uniref:hypothetical protein n=1 Tax=Streptomyces sp. NPDC086091 TaxID=3365751 RepID=UPI00381DBEAA